MRLFSKGQHTEEDIYRRLTFDPDNNTILEALAQVRRDIEDAYTNFQNACDPDLIDCYIYEGNAAWKRYRFLLRQMKSAADRAGGSH